jgi:hypothetical protein
MLALARDAGFTHLRPFGLPWAAGRETGAFRVNLLLLCFPPSPRSFPPPGRPA